MRGCDRFNGTRIFQHDSLRQASGQPTGSAVGQASNQTHWRPVRPLAAQAQPRTFRAGADDRTQVTELLQEHYVAGRLDASELEVRVERALAAVTLADLDAVLADLPPQALTMHTASSQQVGASPRHTDVLRCTAASQNSLRAHATSYLLVMVMLVAIWALTSPGGYFWPVWPMLGWGIGLASHGLAARSSQQRQGVAAGYR